MTTSKATTVSEYLKEIPENQRKEIKKVRELVKKNIGEGFKETINWGMINYEVPLSTYPDTYNKKPLHFIGLAAQKNNISLYLMYIPDTGVTGRTQQGFRSNWKKAEHG